MRNKIFLFMLGLFILSPSVSALSENVIGSWATSNTGNPIMDPDKGYDNRLNLTNSLYEADASEENGRELGFTGIGYFGSEGVTYYFDKFDDEGNRTHYSRLVKNPGDGADLMLREVTWDGDNSTWTAEGVQVYAVNYNGSGEDKLVAYAYNKLAYTRASAKGVQLPQVNGAKVEFSYASDAHNLYDTLIYFSDDFEYCSAIKLVDVTEDLKYLGGNGQNVHDGYDLDAIYGYRVLYSPVGDITYKDETAVSVGDININCESSWQKVVMKVKVADLIENDQTFDIIAGQYYKIGTGRIYLEDGIVKVQYEFIPYYDIKGIDTVKIGIYKDLNNMMKDGKLLGNGKLIADENVTESDEYAYIRLHFDVSIPDYLYDVMDKIDNIDTVCDIISSSDDKDDDNKSCASDKCDDVKDKDKHKVDKNKEHVGDKIDSCLKEVKNKCNKFVNDCHKSVGKICNKINLSVCKFFSR